MTDAELAALRAENAELGKRYNELANLVDRRMGELEAENERLRETLETIKRITIDCEVRELASNMLAHGR